MRRNITRSNLSWANGLIQRDMLPYSMMMKSVHTSLLPRWHIPLKLQRYHNQQRYSRWCIISKSNSVSKIRTCKTMLLTLLTSLFLWALASAEMWGISPSFVLFIFASVEEVSMNCVPPTLGGSPSVVNATAQQKCTGDGNLYYLLWDFAMK